MSDGWDAAKHPDTFVESRDRGVVVGEDLVPDDRIDDPRREDGPWYEVGSSSVSQAALRYYRRPTCQRMHDRDRILEV